MKSKTTLLIGASVVVLFACESNKYKETDRVTVTTDLEKFVDSVDLAVKAHPVHDWGHMNSRFNTLESRADEVYNDLEYQKDGLEVIEDRYETLIANGKRAEKNFEETADMHLENVKKWSDMKAENMKNGVKSATNDVENAAQESMKWLETNMNKLSTDLNEKYNKLKIELEKV